MGSVEDLHVLVVGGGTCGLTIARGLLKEGIRCTIFERDSKVDYFNKTRDWGMMLHWGKEELWRMLPQDLVDRFRETLVDASYGGADPIPHINGETGEVISTVSVPGLVRISRKKMRTFLASKEDLDIKFEKKLVSVTSTERKATLHFADGSRAIGNLVIGCDGSRSRVREFLVGKEAATPFDTGMTLINHDAVGYSAEQAIAMSKFHRISTCFYDPQVNGIFLLTALDTSDKQHPEKWRFQVHHAWWGPPYAADLADSRTCLNFLKARGGRICEPYATAVSALTDDTVLPADAGQQWSPIPWNNHHGSVTIAGDAAHSMLPNRGQGLNNALQDAADLVDVLKTVKDGVRSLEQAVDAYEASMRPRGSRDVALSLETAQNLDVSKLLESPMFKLGLKKSGA